MLAEAIARPGLVAGLVGSLIAGLGTGVGALLIYVKRDWSRQAQVIMLALAAGIMLGATIFSLLLPAMAAAAHDTGSQFEGALIAAGGVLLGALCIWGVHAVVPHEHFVKGPEGATIALGRNWLFILAITIHNFPEGLSVGVAYGNDAASGIAVTLGIGLQNLPEGLAVAAALLGDGCSRSRAFAVALLTGLVEPIGGLVGAVAASVSDAMLPWALGFASGAMLFVISGEVIPETHREGSERLSTFSLVLGFIVMMLLDVLIS